MAIELPLYFLNDVTRELYKIPREFVITKLSPEIAECIFDMYARRIDERNKIGVLVGPYVRCWKFIREWIRDNCAEFVAPYHNIIIKRDDWSRICMIMDNDKRVYAITNGLLHTSDIPTTLTCNCFAVYWCTLHIGEFRHYCETLGLFGASLTKDIKFVGTSENRLVSEEEIRFPVQIFYCVRDLYLRRCKKIAAHFCETYSDGFSCDEIIVQIVEYCK
jgi:hypothetical protein